MNTQTMSKEFLQAEAHRQELIQAIKGDFDLMHPTIEDKKAYLLEKNKGFNLYEFFSQDKTDEQIITEYRLEQAEEHAARLVKKWLTEAGREEEL